MNNESVLENNSINMLKGISCLIVVLLHCPIPGVWGEAIIYGIRFSVPVFFMITGYYSYGKNNHWKIRQIRKTLGFIVYGELFCAVISVIINMSQNELGLCSWIRNLEIVQHPIKILFFGSICNGTLWYLYALFWTLLILFIIDKYFDNEKIIYGLIPFFLFIHIGGRVLIQNYGDINQWVFLFRSAVLFGIPFVLFGRWIAEHETILKRKIKVNTCIGIFSLGLGFEVLEFIFWHQYMDLHFSTIIISFALFWWACLKPYDNHFPVLRIFGKKYSSLVYIVHYPCILVVDTVLRKISIEKMYAICTLMRPVIVIGIALLLAIGIDFLKKKIKYLNLRKKDKIWQR